MGRPRVKDTHLPPGVYFKHGAYYRVVRGVWYRLGETPDLANLRLSMARLPKSLDEHRKEMLAYVYRVMSRARQNAKGRRNGIEFTITKECIHRMLNEAGWKCSVTGAQFSLESVNGTKPFAPSIDRRDSSVGYVTDNCRVVCVAVNYAMNVWGEDVLWRLFAKKRHRELDSVRQIDEITT